MDFEQRNSMTAQGDNWNLVAKMRWTHQMGRFMSPDFSDDPDPVPYADFTNPQSLNLYSYAYNNPLTNTDADGHLAGRLGQQY